MARVRLDQLVVNRGLAVSRERARALVLAGQVSVDGDGGAGLRGRLAVDADAAGQNQRTRTFSRGREAAVDEERIETDGVLQFVRPTTHCAIAGS
jgi:23S rRNA (cytidine1920-2'-O)/16S rRNA (cytidine1409-2'-O)-methyltransferase